MVIYLIRKKRKIFTTFPKHFCARDNKIKMYGCNAVMLKAGPLFLNDV